MAELSPELKQFCNELGDQFSQRVAQHNAQLRGEIVNLQRDVAKSEVAIKDTIDRKFSDLSDRVEDVRSELKSEIGHVQQKQDRQGEILEEHSRDLAVIDERLQTGERRFDGHEKRLDELEKDQKNHGTSIATLAASGAGLGAGLTALIQYIFK